MRLVWQLSIQIRTRPFNGIFQKYINTCTEWCGSVDHQMFKDKKTESSSTMSHQMVNLPQFSLYVIFVFKSWLLHWIFECWIPVKKSLSHWRAKGQDWTPETIPTKISLRRIHSARITFETQWKYSNQRRQYSKNKIPQPFFTDLCFLPYRVDSNTAVVPWLWFAFGTLELIGIPTPQVSCGKDFPWLNMTEPPCSMRSAV